MRNRVVRQIGCLLMLPVFLAAHLICQCGKLAEQAKAVEQASHACCNAKGEQAPEHQKHDADCGHCGVKSQSVLAERSVAPTATMVHPFDLPTADFELPSLAPVAAVVHLGEWGTHSAEPPIDLLLAKCVWLI